MSENPIDDLTEKMISPREFIDFLREQDEEMFGELVEDQDAFETGMAETAEMLTILAAGGADFAERYNLDPPALCALFHLAADYIEASSRLLFAAVDEMIEDAVDEAEEYANSEHESKLQDFAREWLRNWEKDQ